jgi:hypothetical protein
MCVGLVRVGLCDPEAYAARVVVVCGLPSVFYVTRDACVVIRDVLLCVCVCLWR